MFPPARPLLGRLVGAQENDRNGGCRRLGGGGRGDARGDDHGGAAGHQVGRQRPHPIGLTLRGAPIDRHVAALGVTEFVEALMEGFEPRPHHLR
jgi:hypothetical protein